ncbi:CDP-diacylglycerol--serine O-phosphatidyltransferase [Cognatilysobacter bugurensis]|nr:CDP-diacylglycerol--serine O-phosphatidyltransferase [Lysobacter bugurensis]
MPAPPPARPRNRGVYLLPNLFTTGGLFAGYYAIIAATQGRYEFACIAVFIAALLDGVDGRVARLTNTQSEFGVQYDSLADLISFGLAPSLLMYHWALDSLRLDGVTPGKIGWIAAFLYAACAALRLARFNSQVGQVDKRWFIGLASPAAAGLVASFVWTCVSLGLDGRALRYVALAVTVVAALLMVSRLRYYSFKASGPRNDRLPFLAIIVVLAVLIGIAIYPPGVLLAICAAYALAGPMHSVVRRVRRAPAESAP